MALVKEYFDLTRRYQAEYGENTVLLMQVGAFFEVYGLLDRDTRAVHGSQITAFSRICEMSVVEKNVCVGAHPVMMAGFNELQLERYIKKLQEACFTVVVYVQDESVIGIKGTTRSLLGIFSPGTYFQTDTSALSNSTTCIWVDYVENSLFRKGKYVVVGMANLDIYTGKTSLYQFKEMYVDSPTTYDELEKFISVVRPSEVILISNLPDPKDTDKVLNYAGVSCSAVHVHHLCDKRATPDPKALPDPPKSDFIKNCEKQSYQREILSKFYTFDDFSAFLSNFHENHIATQAFCYLLDFMYQHNAQLVNKIALPVFEGTGKRLSLANHSLKQLNILHDGQTKPTKYSSVMDMLNGCLTPMGKRLFAHNLLNPVCDPDWLTREYDMTDYVLGHFDHFNGVCLSRLTAIKDLTKFERLLCIRKLSPKMVGMFYTSVREARALFDALRDDATWMAYLAPDVAEDFGDLCDQVTQFIERHIDLELAKDLEQCSQFEVNCICAGVDEALDKKARMLADSEAGLEAVREYLSGLIEAKENKPGNYVKIHETGKNNYSLIATVRRCNLLKQALPPTRTVVTLSTGNGNTLALTVSKTQFEFESALSSNNSINDAQITSLCRTISSMKISMKEQITTVYNKVLDELGSFQKELERIIQFVTRVDVLFTKACIAKRFNYCRPVLETEALKAFVDARGLRHALIEQFNTQEVYVTNDLSLGDGKVDGILLFGTNAVGKTTLIRALGIAVIMAQAGLFVPCSSFHYKPYKHIFTRILGNDNLFKGLSTFEVEMSELRTILRLMDEDSLVLGDELCSGTETVSAISIFVAGIQKLYQAKSSFIFATHLHEIVDYQEVTSMTTVVMKHMEVVYNKALDALVYNRKLKDGSGANVYGLEVCKALQLPADFMEMANAIRIKYNTDGQSMLTLKPSRYNVQKIVHVCERCGKQRGKEVHHLAHQATANEDGIIVGEDGATFHKNHLANLMTLCEACHDELHHSGVKQRRVKTSKGVKVLDINESSPGQEKPEEERMPKGSTATQALTNLEPNSINPFDRFKCTSFPVAHNKRK